MQFYIMAFKYPKTITWRFNKKKKEYIPAFKTAKRYSKVEHSIFVGELPDAIIRMRQIARNTGDFENRTAGERARQRSYRKQIKTTIDSWQYFTVFKLFAISKDGAWCVNSADDLNNVRGESYKNIELV